MLGLKSLRVYDAAQRFAAAVTRCIRSSALPNEDADQLRRSTKSISDNIAEGHGYGPGKNRLRFYRIARGSAEESLNQLKQLHREQLLSRREFYSLFSLGLTI